MSLDAPRLRVANVVARLEGGAGRQVLRGLQALDPERFERTIVTGSGAALIDDARAAGIDVVVVPSLRAPVEPASDVRALRALEHRLVPSCFDVVHTHCSKAGVIGRVAAHLAGVSAVVHTYHGFGFHDFQPAPVRAAYVEVERLVGRWTDLALCVGNGVADEARRRRLVDPARIRTIGVAVDERFGCHAEDPVAGTRARRCLGLPQSATVVGTVGRLTYQKAPQDFVRMLAALGRPDVVGVWIGDGELAERTRLEAVRQGVRLVLAGERDGVHDLLPALDVFALLSRYEGLPTVLVEAMLSGVPVVATDVNSVQDLVVGGRTGLLVPPGRPSDAADGVRRMLDDAGLAMRLATRARQHVAGRYTAAVLRDQLVEAYVSTATGGERRRDAARSAA